MKKNVFLIVILSVVCAVWVWAGGGQNQGDRVWPTTRTVEVICNASAGSGTGNVARFVAAYLQKKLGINFPVINDDSGNQIAGYERIRNARPDGSTIHFYTVDTIMVYLQGLYPHNIFEDFTFITLFRVPIEPFMIVVRADSPYKTLQDLVDDAKARPGMVTVPAGLVGQAYARTKLVERALGVQFRYTDGKNNADRIPSILGGHTDWVTLDASANSYVESGQMRYLAFISNERSKLHPEVPCLGELGFTMPSDEVSNFSSNYVVTGPPGMDESVANAIAEALQGIDSDEETRTRLWNQEKGYPQYVPREEAKKIASDLFAYMKTLDLRIQ